MVCNLPDNLIASIQDSVYRLIDSNFIQYCLDIPLTYMQDVNGQVQREIVSRVTNCFQLLFMPGKKQEESDSDVLRAFSILLGVPSVAKPLLCQCLSVRTA